MRWVEVYVGPGWRHWSSDEKAWNVEETLAARRGRPKPFTKGDVRLASPHAMGNLYWGTNDRYSPPCRDNGRVDRHDSTHWGHT